MRAQLRACPSLLSILLLASSASGQAQDGMTQALGGDRPDGQTTELLLLNGRLFGAPGANALLVRGEKIAAVGQADALRQQAGEGVRVLDARGAVILPGFHDAHTHLLGGGLSLNQLNVGEAGSVAEVQEALRTYAQEHAELAWIQGLGWGYELFGEGGPTRQALDEVVSARPVLLESYDGHALWVNSKALELAGVGPESPNPEGGEIVREADGKTPSGALLEDAGGLVLEVVPEAGRAAEKAALEEALARCLQLGITSAEAFGWGGESLELWSELEREGKLPIRVSVCLPLEEGDLEQYAALRERYNSPLLRIGFLKGYLDGVVESRTALMVDPYPESQERGEALIEREGLFELVGAAHARGFSVGLHAVGDGAVRLALDAYEEAHRRHPEVLVRHRVEHAEVIHPEDLPRFARLDVIASMQPIHAHPGDDPSESGSWGENMGAARMPHTFPWKALLRHKARLAFGSDWPVAEMEPLPALAVAMTRQNEAGLPEGGSQPHQALSWREAVTAYSLGPAYAIRREGELGRLAPGQLADLVVLSPEADPAQPLSLWEAEVRHVIVGGKLSWSAD